VTFFAGRRGRPTRKKSKGLRRKPKQCGVLGGQMAFHEKAFCVKVNVVSEAQTKVSNRERLSLCFHSHSR
jgi:hypothetical protein